MLVKEKVTSQDSYRVSQLCRFCKAHSVNIFNFGTVHIRTQYRQGNVSERYVVKRIYYRTAIDEVPKAVTMGIAVLYVKPCYLVKKIAVSEDNTASIFRKKEGKK
jgi:hypothetical protein